MKVMVLGASGYLGKKVVDALMRGGASVTGTCHRNLPKGQQGLCCMILSDVSQMRKELDGGGYDWVVNCAAAYEHAGALPHEVVDANMVFALQALDCAVECGVKKFLTIDTSLPPDLNLYSFTKSRFAEFGKFYAKNYGIDFINVLLEMFYGEDEPDGRFLSGSCRRMLRDETLELTEGSQRRDVIYIDDVCRAVCFLIAQPLSGYCDVPLGSGEAASVREMMEYLYEITGKKSRLEFGAISARNGEPDCVADMSFLRDMGFDIRYTWRQGFDLMCERMRQSV